MKKKRSEMPHWFNLADRVQATLSILGIGSQKKLAEHLGVNPQQVYDWITARTREPGANTAIQLFDWVMRKESEFLITNKMEDYKQALMRVRRKQK